MFGNDPWDYSPPTFLAPRPCIYNDRGAGSGVVPSSDPIVRGVGVPGKAKRVSECVDVLTPVSSAPRLTNYPRGPGCPPSRRRFTIWGWGYPGR